MIDLVLWLNEELALMDARIRNLLVRVDMGESGVACRDCRAALVAFHKARQRQDTDGMAEALRQMDRLLGQAMADHAAWEEVGKAVDRHMRLVQSERKRMVEVQQKLSLGQALVMVSALSNAARRRVDDADTLNAIAADLQSVMDGRTPIPVRVPTQPRR